MTGRLLAFVRHGAAGSRSRWESNDALRPLTPKGHRQAMAIAERYSPNCSRIVSSPFVRCIEMLSPLAMATNVALEEVDLLSEGADPLNAYRWLINAAIELADERALVSCTHGDLLFGFVELLAAAGHDIDRHGATIQKGSAIEVELVGSGVVAARYLAPEQVAD